MFNKEVYTDRRNKLKKEINNGIVLIVGNDEMPMNYKSNAFPFRQDSNFLYFFGLDAPKLIGVIDVDEDEEYIVGDDFTLDDIIWMGAQPSLNERGAKAGITNIMPLNKFVSEIQQKISSEKPVHILPPYSAKRILFLGELFSSNPLQVEKYISLELIKAVARLRSIKQDIEIKEIEDTLTNQTWDMHVNTMKMANAGVMEHEISGAIEGLARRNDRLVPYPVICSVRGEVLHNHVHNNRLKEGQLLLTDAGCESPEHYATDITRTVPVGRKFSNRQKNLYTIVLQMLQESIKNVKPGVAYKDIHLNACKILAKGLISEGLMKGDPDEAVAAGAHAMFMPHGLGHMIGLDVHDMEDLGEDNFAYDDEIRRSSQFGTANLRLGKKLEPGYVLTVEPGVYFIPELANQWKGQNLHESFINYAAVEKFLDFGGIRIEDNVLVTDSGQRILGKPIPKTIKEIENMA